MCLFSRRFFSEREGLLALAIVAWVQLRQPTFTQPTLSLRELGSHSATTSYLISVRALTNNKQSIMNLSQAQTDLLNQLKTDLNKGLSADEVLSRREAAGSFNVVDPPVKCPGWICCLLPCIKHIPSMKAFRQIKPDDAEVLRNGKWIRYDAASLVKGDIIRLEEGDQVPADCVVLQLEDTSHELLVDHRSVTGEEKPRSAKQIQDGFVQPTQLYWGAQVVQGSAVAVATGVGSDTLVASLIREKRFPPTENVVEMMSPHADDLDQEDGISLITRDVL